MKLILRRITAVVLLAVMVITGCVCQVSAQEKQENKLQLYAQSAVLMDAGSGRILYEKNAHQIMPMASTTKIMTCILTLECGNLEDYAQASSYAASMPKVKLGVQKGEYYKIKDLLYSLMLESHNDAAVVIAEHIGGSVEAFAGMMNQKARDIGCYDTFFITPNGLDATATNKNGEAKTHSTTAADLAKIMSYCILESPKKEAFLEITRTANYQLSAYKEAEGSFVPNGRSFSCYNHNAFLDMMEGALSGKTGFTNNAGYCYVGSLKRDGRIYVVALLACGWPNNKSYKWSDTKELMEYGLEHFVSKSFAEVKVKESSLKPVMVTDGQTQHIGEAAYIPVKIMPRDDGSGITEILMREMEEIEVVCRQEEVLKAPVEAGMTVGEILYRVDGKDYIVEKIVTAQDVAVIDLKWCVEQILKVYLIAFG